MTLITFWIDLKALEKNRGKAVTVNRQVSSMKGETRTYCGLAFTGGNEGHVSPSKTATQLLTYLDETWVYILIYNIKQNLHFKYVN